MCVVGSDQRMRRADHIICHALHAVNAELAVMPQRFATTLSGQSGTHTLISGQVGGLGGFALKYMSRRIHRPRRLFAGWGALPLGASAGRSLVQDGGL